MRSEKSGAPSAACAASLIRERRRSSSNGNVVSTRPNGKGSCRPPLMKWRISSGLAGGVRVTRTMLIVQLLLSR